MNLGIPALKTPTAVRRRSHKAQLVPTEPGHLKAVARCLSLTLLLMHAAPLAAQEESSNGWAESIHAERGAVAYSKGKYAKAVEHFSRALEARELNILYLNLGLSHLALGQCQESQQALERALTAPAVVSPPAEEIQESAKEAMASLDERCRGTLELLCEPEGIDVSIDGEPAGQCPRGVFTLREGIHTLEFFQDGKLMATRQFFVQKEQSKVFKVEVLLPQDVPPPPPVEVDLVPYVLMGSGILLATAGLALDTLPGSSRDGQLEGVDFVPVTLYVLGGATITYSFFW